MATTAKKPKTSSHKGSGSKEAKVVSNKLPLTFAPFTVREVELFTQSVRRTAGTEPEGKPEFTIGAKLNNVSHQERLSLGFLDIQVEKAFDAEPLCVIEASYVFAIVTNQQSDPDLKDEYLKFAASTCVWPRFIDLFNTIVGQLDIKFPALPMQPPRIKIVSGKDDLTNE